MLLDQKWKDDGKIVDERWNGERPIVEESRGSAKENKIMLKEIGFVALCIILYLQYFKLAGYLSNKYFFASDFMGLLLLILGFPLSYFAAKYLAKILKGVLS